MCLIVCPFFELENIFKEEEKFLVGPILYVLQMVIAVWAGDVEDIVWSAKFLII